MSSEHRQDVGLIVVNEVCGFLDFYITHALRQEPGCASVVVLSRNPDRNRQEGVEYHSCDITNADATRSLLKPRVIIHAASPLGNGPTLKAQIFRRANVDGTTTLLSCGTEILSIKAFVYTSSVNVITGNQHINMDEQQPFWDPKDPKVAPYRHSRAAAEKLVLAANS